MRFYIVFGYKLRWYIIKIVFCMWYKIDYGYLFSYILILYIFLWNVNVNGIFIRKWDMGFSYFWVDLSVI